MDDTLPPCPPAADERPRLSAGRKLLYSSFVALATFAAVESYLRVELRLRHGTWDIADRADPARRQPLYERDPVLGVVLRPGAELEEAPWDDADDRPRKVSVSEQGFRGPSITRVKPEGTLRIACLGGSTTFDTHVSSNERTWTARLEEKLRAANPGRKVEVINAGCPGYTSRDSRHNYERRVAAFDPDIVVVLHAFNDVNAISQPGWEDRDAPSVVIPDYDPGPPVLRQSMIYYKIRHRLARHERRRRREAARRAADGLPSESVTSADSTGPADDVPQAGIAAFERNLRELIAAADDDGARVVLLTFPRPYSSERAPEPHVAELLRLWAPHLSTEGVERAISRCDAVVTRLAQELPGVTFIDARAAIGPDPMLFADHCHLNDDGAERLAGALAEELLRSDLLGRDG